MLLQKALLKCLLKLIIRLLLKIQVLISQYINLHEKWIQGLRKKKLTFVDSILCVRHFTYIFFHLIFVPIMCSAVDIVIPNSQIWKMSSERLSIFPYFTGWQWQEQDCQSYTVFFREHYVAFTVTTTQQTAAIHRGRCYLTTHHYCTLSN